MPLTTAQQVRLRIQDLPALADATYYGDGSGSAYALPHRNLTSAAAFVPGTNGQWSATGATFDVSGVVTFSGVISANTAYRTRYTFSVFSDEEIGHFTAVGGSVAGAALEACRDLMFDSLKRASWAAPDGSQYDDTRAIEMLKTLHDTLQQEIATVQVADGGFISWAQNQETQW